MYDVATQAKVALWRKKAIEGTLNQEDTKEALALLAAGRRSAAYASSSAKGARVAKKAAVAALPSGDDLLDEML